MKYTKLAEAAEWALAEMDGLTEDWEGRSHDERLADFEGRRKESGDELAKIISKAHHTAFDIKSGDWDRQDEFDHTQDNSEEPWGRILRMQQDKKEQEEKVRAAEEEIKEIEGKILMDSNVGPLHICTERGKDGTLYLGCGVPTGNFGDLHAEYKIPYDLDMGLQHNLEALMDELENNGVREWSEEEDA